MEEPELLTEEHEGTAAAPSGHTITEAVPVPVPQLPHSRSDNGLELVNELAQKLHHQQLPTTVQERPEELYESDSREESPTMGGHSGSFPPYFLVGNKPSKEPKRSLLSLATSGSARKQRVNDDDDSIIENLKAPKRTNRRFGRTMSGPNVPAAMLLAAFCPIRAGLVYQVRRCQSIEEGPEPRAEFVVLPCSLCTNGLLSFGMDSYNTD